MSRRITTDFDQLKLFFSEYTLKSHLLNETQVTECKAMHKKLYGFMLFIAESNRQKGSSAMGTYLAEMASDLLLSMFNWLQGMYKPAKLELRCSIENFLKALQSVDNPHILIEKSMSAVFDAAKNDQHFNNTYSATILAKFKSDYAVLCQIAHSAPRSIDSISALNLLPKYDPKISDEVVTIFIRVIENSMGILYTQYPSVIDKMHPDNKKDFLDCLAKSTKEEINKYLYDL